MDSVSYQEVRLIGKRARCVSYKSNEFLMVGNGALKHSATNNV